jgi:uncharacterized protein YndB with AHSA1/START domain
MHRPKHIYETYIRADAQTIWRAITTPEFTRQYFHAMAIESDWSVGAPVTFRYADGRIGCEGVLLEITPPRRLAYTWRFLFDAELAKERPSRVTFEIEPRGRVSVLRVTHDDFDADSKVYPMISKGWAEIVSSLKSLLETGQPLEIAGNAASDAA